MRILKEGKTEKGYIIYTATKNGTQKRNKVKDLVISVMNEFQSREELYDIQTQLESRNDNILSDRVYEVNRDIISFSVYTQVNGYEYKILFVLKPYEQIKFKTFLNYVVNIIDEENQTNKTELKITLLSFDNIYLLSAFSDARELIFKDYNTYKMKRSILTRQNRYLKGNHSDDKVKNCFKLISNSNHSMFVKVKLRDAAVLMDKRNFTFTKLGKSVGIKRKELKLDEVRDLRNLLKTNEELYFNYETNLSEIIYKWTEESYGDNIPETLSKHAEDFAYKFLKKEIKAKNSNDFMKKYSGRWRRYNTQTKHLGLSYGKGLKDASEFARRSYYGGLNNAYTVGMFFDKTYDVDIRQAYITAIYLLSDIDFNKEPEDITNINPEEIKVNDYAFVKANVYYPEDFTHPCLPVKSEIFQTTVFVREATDVYLSAPEIWYAVNNGARVEIKGGYRLSTKDTHVMKKLAEHLITERNKLKDNPLKEKIQKLTNNMIYGNISKGVTMKTMNRFMYGKITNEYYASTLTSLVRVLLSQTMKLVEESETATKNDIKGMKMYTGLTITDRKVKGAVYEAVTDGFITNLTEEEVNKLMRDNKDNPIISMFLKGRAEIGKKNLPFLKEKLSEVRKEMRETDKRKRALINNLSGKVKDLKHKINTVNNIYEIKHEQDILYVGRTRNAVGVNFKNPSKSAMTLANMSYPKQSRLEAKQDVRLFVLHMLLNRKEEELVSIYQSIPRVEKFISNERLDISVNEKERRANLEFDNKRMINEIKEVNVNLIKMNERQIKNGSKEYNTYQATTKPHKDLEEFEKYRYFMKEEKMVLTTKQDFVDFYSKIAYKENNVRLTSDINTLNAKQILVLLKKGILIDEENRQGTEIFEDVENLFGVKLNYNNDYSRAKNKMHLTNFDFLMNDIKALNLTRA